MQDTISRFGGHGICRSDNVFARIGSGIHGDIIIGAY